jgi:pSer/pThr/pTyr-binding forkhead associated (FHA) protein
MWKLTIEDDEGKQTQLPLAHEEYGVGRDEANSIRLTDRNISRKHASLRKNGQGWVLKDNQSYNGTYVNGVRVIGEQGVGSGDVIQLGDYRIEVLDEVLLAQQPAAAPTAPPAHQRPNRLVVVVGPSPGAEFPLDKEHFTIGRSEEATISINHSSVSRVHAELFALGNGRFEIVDKASANGIRINGVELKRGILEAGDALELGDVRLRFVGAGKIFRADMTLNLPAVAGFDMSRSVAAAESRSRLGKLIMLGGAIGLVAIIGLVAFVSRGGPAEAPHKPRVITEKSAKQVDDAMKLLAAKDVEGAHKKLMEIPEDDWPTDDANFQTGEGAWADARFAEVDAAPDSAGKKTILRVIASQGSVDAQRRRKASQMISEIEAKEPPAPAVNEPHMGGGVGLPHHDGSEPAPSAAASAGPTAIVVQNGPAPAPPDENAIRRSLENKVRGGRASVDEIRMLKAVCSHMGDKACRNMAAAARAAKTGN